ncbi:hypothetical protein HHK36_017087 [Tetracentron sinense]|uniref:Uncharacterized protein n=1 Tax=Tetracentron sinense TaxID=13715 RepID=A0A835DCH7_TETSI|nr:hypothetical protein HHK36_017087 [Tetracentron sinense]
MHSSLRVRDKDLHQSLRFLKDVGVSDVTVTRILEEFPEGIMMKRHDLGCMIEFLKGIGRSQKRGLSMEAAELSRCLEMLRALKCRIAIKEKILRGLLELVLNVIEYLRSKRRLGSVVGLKGLIKPSRLRCHGTLSVYQSNISKHNLDLKQVQYNDIDKRKPLMQTSEMANKDLDRYYNALDK